MSKIEMVETSYNVSAGLSLSWMVVMFVGASLCYIVTEGTENILTLVTYDWLFELYNTGFTDCLNNLTTGIPNIGSVEMQFNTVRGILLPIRELSVEILARLNPILPNIAENHSIYFNIIGSHADRVQDVIRLIDLRLNLLAYQGTLLNEYQAM